VLDVLQIFGRAGRPQYDSTGHAILITPHTSLNNYLALLAHQTPIESSLIKALPDHLNAEIVNGTINNIKEASSWLRYTFLFVRMAKNPLVYGLSQEEHFDDPQLEKRRLELVRIAATALDACMMIRYDVQSGNLAVTDLGRVASHYYIRHGTIQAFNAMLSSHMADSDALHVLCSAAEFDQLKVRPEELTEIDQLKKHATIKVRGPVEDTAGKVGVLLQGYVAQARVTSFTLQSDSNYVAQNAGRISRALFEICLKRGWSTMAHHYLGLSKSIDRRMRVDQNPLRQFNELPVEAIQHLENINAAAHTLLDMSPREVGSLCHNQKLGGRLLDYVRLLPSLHIESFVQPLTRGVMRMCLTVTCDFVWSERWHGSLEPFWIWVEDGESEYIYHSEYFLLHKRQKSDEHKVEFVIPVRDPMPPQYYVRCVSDRWVGCENVITVSFQHLILPDRYPPHTELFDMHPVPKSALKNSMFESIYKFSHFNPLQSQVYLYK
jgi:replicative superfamily II helicase